MNNIDPCPKTKKSFSIEKFLKKLFNLFKTSSLTETNPNGTAPSLNFPNKAEVPQQGKSQQTGTTSFWEMPIEPGTNAPLLEQSELPVDPTSNDTNEANTPNVNHGEKQSVVCHETISELMKASFNN